MEKVKMKMEKLLSIQENQTKFSKNKKKKTVFPINRLEQTSKLRYGRYRKGLSSNLLLVCI